MTSEPDPQPDPIARDEEAGAIAMQASMRIGGQTERHIATSLQFIRHVAQRLRDAQQQAGHVTDEARRMASDAVAALREAEARVARAEADVVAALARAEAAEEQVRLLRLQMEPAETSSSFIDRWVKEAHQQLRQTRESRDGPPSR
jgi:hypothetical protein